MGILAAAVEQFAEDTDRRDGQPSGPANAPASPTLAASVIIIDDSIVITGSFHFTKAAETRNAENVVVIDSPAVATWFTRNWEEPRSTSRRFETE